MNIIKAVNLVFDYIRRDEEGQVEEVKRALDHVNLEIEKGSFVAILGHNGSGKMASSSACATARRSSL